MTHEEFCEQTDFVKVYTGVIERYPKPKRKPKTASTIASMINDMAVGRHQLSYYRLRAISEFVGLPTGLFSIWTHALGDQRHAEEARADPHDACLDLIDGVIRFAGAAKQYIEMDKLRGGSLFMKKYDDDPKSNLPSVDVLKRLADAFNNKPESTGQPN